MINLLKRKTSLGLRIKKSSYLITLLRQQIHRMESKHGRLLIEYQRTDYLLALKDGRFHKIEEKKKTRDLKKEVKKLSIAQIEAIAKILDIELKE